MRYNIGEIMTFESKIHYANGIFNGFNVPCAVCLWANMSIYK